MRSQPLRAEISRRRAEERFKSTKKVDLKEAPEADSLRQAETAKTARLRVLRLAKEAADKETANREAAAAKARRTGPRRRAPGPQFSSPSEAK
jgi:hypothetical protein